MTLLTTLQALVKQRQSPEGSVLDYFDASKKLTALLRTHADDLVRLVEAAQEAIQNTEAIPTDADDECSKADREGWAHLKTHSDWSAFVAALTPFTQEPTDG